MKVGHVGNRAHLMDNYPSSLNVGSGTGVMDVKKGRHVEVSQ